MVSEDKLREDARGQIVEFVQRRFSKVKDTSLQDIQDVFQKPPYGFSEGTVINYLDELVAIRKLSTWKVKNRRYYGPPKLPLPLKIGGAIAAIIIFTSILIDTLVPPMTIYQYVYLGFTEVKEPTNIHHSTMLPLTIYLLAFTALFTAIWYFTNRKIYK